MSFASKRGQVLGIVRERNLKMLAIFFVLITFGRLAASQSLLLPTGPQSFSILTTSGAEDPNKGPSELNHHIAGWALIGIGLLQLEGLLFPHHRTHRYIWPALFVLAGLFLALWSDGEIWPRGNLNWSFLLQHDAEARQHKIYSILLIAIGILEYVRMRGSLPRFWKTWGFPLLAVIGASLLLMHDHSGGSGARSPEAQSYLVDPARDVDGSVRNPKAFTTVPAAAEAHHQTTHDVSEDAASPSMLQPGAMPMDHSQMMMDAESHSPVPKDQHHMMTASMLLVEREHLWFLIVGLAIAMFKFLADGEFFQNHIVPYMAPGGMLLLGLLLMLYRE